MDKDRLLLIYKEIVSKNSGSKTKAKQILLHEYLASEIEKNINLEKYELRYINSDGTNKEFKYKGPLFNKNTDIAIIEKESGLLKAAFPVKMVFSNYSQNAKNYYEQMIAEAFNLKQNGVLVYNIIILNMWPPYFKEARTSIKNIENPMEMKNYELYEKFSSYKNGYLSDGILYALIDFDDKEIYEEFMKKSSFDFSELSSRLINRKEINVEIHYPFLDKKIINSLSFDTLGKKVREDLDKNDSSKVNFSSFKNINFKCPICNKMFSSEEQLYNHENCIIKSSERRNTIEIYLKNHK